MFKYEKYRELDIFDVDSFRQKYAQAIGGENET